VAALRSGPGGHLLVGIRHLVHDEADPGWLSRPEVKRGLRAVADAGLVYDLLVRSRELPSALAAVDAVDGGRFVLDHGAKPEIATGGAQPWSDLVADLARRPNVVCKLSGLVTEAGPAWTLEQIAPYVDHLLDTFGPDRLLFGSDWPVCTVRAGYADVVELARSLLAERLSADERAKVMWANAQETYGLDVRRP
jgi:L-fuconolactonase